MTKPLEGLRVLNTRPAEQARILSQCIEQQGGQAIECPALSIEPLSAWLQSLPNLTKVDQAIFVSRNAVKHCFTKLHLQQIIWPKAIHVIAVGQSTSAALADFNINVHSVPDIADSEHLVALEALQQINQQTILLIKGVGGRTLISETLAARGATILPIEVYQRTIPTLNQQWLDSLQREDAVDIILFTSQQLMHNIFNLFSKKAHTWLRSKPCLVISKRLAKEAATLGMRTIIQSRPEELLQTLHQFNQGLTHGQYQ